MSSSNLVSIRYKKESSYGVVNPAVKASKVIQDLTYTALKGGALGNAISIQYANTATAGAETVVVNGNAILVGIQSGTSTATQVRTAVMASTPAMLLLSTVVVSGVGSNPQTTVSATVLTGGLYDWKQARFTSEKYSGTPETTESQQIRTDRQSSGQVVTGLTVGGGHNFELAKDGAIEDYMESAMFSAWVTSVAVNANFEIDIDTKKLIRVSGSFIDEGVKVGDVLVLSNFVTAGNNVPVMATVVTALEITFAGPTGMLDAASEAATYQIADKLSIGITPKSLSVEKCFLDLTTKAIVYKGMLANQMELDVQYGSLISGNFDMMGNDYDPAESAAAFATYQEYITDPATTNTLNGSVDMPFLTTNVTGTFVQDGLCIQSLKVALNNNLNAQTCIGRAAPENYTPGTASVKVDLSSYLKDGNWGLLAKKLSQEAFALGFMVKNLEGWYAFYFPAIQVSFDDPSSAGANQDISMDMSGMAKVGSGGESAMSIFRLPA